MTEKQKKAFLKAEGWKRISLLPLGSNQITWTWQDPRDKTCWRLPIAFATASRRKRQREYRKLWGAGWLASRKYPGLWTNGKGLYLTRREALQTLEQKP